MDSIRMRGLFAALPLAAALAVALPAAAEPVTPAAEEADTGPEAGTPRLAAPDTRTGHLLISPRVDVTAPAGYFTSGIRVKDPRTGALSPATSGTATSDVVGTGMSLGGTLGIGISRYATLEATGAYTLFLPSPFGVGSQGRSLDLGLGLAYHLAQGVAIDPWASFGVGLRLTNFTTVTTPAQGSPSPTEAAAVSHFQSYRGIDFARIALGADFYPVPSLGIGPYFEADLGTNFSQVDPESDKVTTVTNLDIDRARAVYAFIHVGVRITLDPFRSGSPRPRATASRGGK